jgi:predicted  nucleic acid-binding Zn-ribbon protein
LEDVLKRPFKVRSAERDDKTDEHRIAPILAAIEVALGDATKEIEALRIRVRDARDLASFAAGTESDEYLSREAKDDRRISDYEQQLIAGENRIRQLDRQISSLTELRDLSNNRFPEAK